MSAFFGRHISLLSLISLAFLTLSLMAPARDEDYFPPGDGAGGWRTLRDSAQIRKITGIDVKKLDQAFEYAQRTNQHGGLLVVRHGWLVYERYYGRGNREALPDMASIGKSLTSVACGIMLKEKHDQIPEGLDQKVFIEKYLPESFPLNNPIKADIRLGHLLAMASGMHGEGSNPGFVNGEPSVKLEAVPPTDGTQDQDLGAVREVMWTKPGEGYSYASRSAHVASMVLRRLTGMELQQYINERLAKPMQWGPWGYATHRGERTLAHTPGGGGCALRSTDALRFVYLLLKKGRWSERQLVPADYVEHCGRPSSFNRHSPFSLMFEVNADGHVAGAPRDAFFKSGGGGYGIYVVPSLDLVIYKMAGSERQYDPALTGIPQTYKYDGSRDNWKPATRSQFSDGPIGTDDGVRRVLEMVVASVME
jgi:CubicO group peptidase (beta-lactamase class C family)